VYRFLLTPRWLGITALSLLAIPVCVFMGTWQLSRFDARVAASRAANHLPAPGSQHAVPLGRALPTVGSQVDQATQGHAVTATGRFDPGHQMLVPDRYLGQRIGFYVLTPLRTAGGGLAVVRGWLPGDASHPGRIPPAPTGQVTVTGALQVSEAVGDSGVDDSGDLPPGQLGMISSASLINLVPYPVYNGWITAATAAAPLRAVPPTAAPNTGLDPEEFMNLGYTGEWFVFAGFVVFIWIRLARREAEVARDLALGLVPDDEFGGSGTTGPQVGPDEAGPDGTGPQPRTGQQTASAPAAR
jgi:cytochrome oxidase assembly protein ShyY1